MDPNLNVNDLTANTATVIQGFSVLEGPAFFEDNVALSSANLTITQGFLTVTDAFRTGSGGPTSVTGTLRVGGDLEAAGDHLSTAGNLFVAQDLFADRSTSNATSTVGGAIDVHGSLTAGDGVLTVHAADRQIQIIAEEDRLGDTAMVGTSRITGQLHVAERTTLSGGLSTSTINVSGRTELDGLTVAERIHVGATGLLVNGTTRLAGAVTIVAPLEVTSAHRELGNQVIHQRDADGTGSLTAAVPTTVSSNLTQQHGRVDLLGNVLSAPATNIRTGANLTVSAGDANLQRDVIVGRDTTVNGSSQLNGGLTVNQGAVFTNGSMYAARNRIQRLGNVITSDLLVDEGHNFHVANGKSYLKGDMYVGGDVTLNGEAYKSYFETYLVEGPDFQPATSWEAYIDTTLWDGDTFRWQEEHYILRGRGGGSAKDWDSRIDDTRWEGDTFRWEVDEYTLRGRSGGAADSWDANIDQNTWDGEVWHANMTNDVRWRSPEQLYEGIGGAFATTIEVRVDDYQTYGDSGSEWKAGFDTIDFWGNGNGPAETVMSVHGKHRVTSATGAPPAKYGVLDDQVLIEAQSCYQGLIPIPVPPLPSIVIGFGFPPGSVLVSVAEFNDFLDLWATVQSLTNALNNHGLIYPAIFGSPIPF